MKRLPKNHFFDLDALRFSYAQADKGVIKQAYEKIEEKLASVKEKPKPSQWNDYWKEMAEANAAHPSFFKKAALGDSIFRYNGSFITTKKSDLAVDVLHQIIGNMVCRLPSSVKNIVEFGCGNGHNLDYIRKNFPAYSLTGCDISEWAVQTVKKKGFLGHVFDMTDPDFDITLPKGVDTVYFTSGAMEQVGKKWKPFFRFLRDSGVPYIFHIEPIYELYSRYKRQERLAAQFHEIKGYLSGYFPFLGEQKDFAVEYSKSDFGTLFDQGFNVLLLTRK